MAASIVLSLALVTRFIAFASRTSNAAMTQIEASLEEAAYVSGARKATRARAHPVSVASADIRRRMDIRGGECLPQPERIAAPVDARRTS